MCKKCDAEEARLDSELPGFSEKLAQYRIFKTQKHTTEANRK